MGTVPFVALVALLPLVSNPLGWDGDPEKIKSEWDANEVSNPLGWDGDLVKTGFSSELEIVSNPLGWDGDLQKARGEE